MEGEYDLRLRNAGLNQFRGDAVLGVVFLNPDLVSHEVDVDEGEMHALASVPANRDERVPIVLGVEKRLAAQIAVGLKPCRPGSRGNPRCPFLERRGAAGNRRAGACKPGR